MLKLRPALQSSQGRSRAWGGAQLINCYAEKADGDKRDDFAVMCSPGLDLWASIASGPIRGAYVVAETLYVVSGASLYSVDGSGNETLIGGIAGTGPVRMSGNFSELCIAAGGNGYVYSGGSLTTPVPFSVSDVAYIDGYMLWVIEDSEQFTISALDDALTYDAADIASAEGFPDDILGVCVDHREVQFYGEHTIEIFYNSGAADFPIERQGNAFIERGCFDRQSIVKIDNTVNFVGDDRIVYSLSGYQPQRISTHAVEYVLSYATYVYGFSYTQEGHKFYGIETDLGTWLFDHSTGAWHQRQSYNQTHWRAYLAVVAYGNTLLCDRASGKIYIPNLDSFTENTDPILMDIYPPVIESGRERAVMTAYEVVCQTGVGNGAVTTPQIMLRYSDDSKQNWSNEMWRSLGAVGNTATRVIWRKLGMFRQRNMHLRISDAVRRLVIAHYADLEA